MFLLSLHLAMPPSIEIRFWMYSNLGATIRAA